MRHRIAYCAPGASDGDVSHSQRRRRFEVAAEGGQHPTRVQRSGRGASAPEVRAKSRCRSRSTDQQWTCHSAEVRPRRTRRRRPPCGPVVGGDLIAEERLDCPEVEREQLRHRLSVDDQAGKAVEQRDHGARRAPAGGGRRAVLANFSGCGRRIRRGDRRRRRRTQRPVSVPASRASTCDSSLFAARSSRPGLATTEARRPVPAAAHAGAL